MSKLPRWTANEAARALVDKGFELLRIKGSHHIYGKESQRVTIPFHSGATLHPKIIKQVLETLEASPTPLN